MAQRESDTIKDELNMKVAQGADLGFLEMGFICIKV